MKKYILIALATFSLIVLAATSYTTNYNLAKPADGDSGWGDSYRANMDTIDAQMFINSSTTQDHIDNPTGAHEATAISATPGATVCLNVDDVQEYLDCIEDQVGTIIGGTVVTTDTEQNITATKNFTATPIFSEMSTGVLHSDSEGNLSSYAILNDDVDASAAIERSKLASATAHGLLVNDDSGVMSELGPLTNGQLLIGSTGAAASTATISGTTDQITVTNGAGSITLSTPQDIATDSSPTFTNVTADLTGNASTATALAANPTDCGAGTKATAIAANGDLTCSAVDVTADVSGVLPLANGGTNKNLTPDAGAVIYTDADSLEVTAVGTTGQVLTSQGTSAPIWTTAGAGDVVNPMDSAGDIIVGGASGAPAKLDSGTAGQYLRSAGAASPTWEGPVVAIYRTNAGQNINSAAEIVDYEDVVVDTHSAVTVGASWVFTAPRAGFYQVCAMNYFTGTTEFDEGEQFFQYLYVGGSEYSNLAFFEMETSPTSNIILGGNGCDVVQMAASDTLNVRITQGSLAAGGLTLTTNASLNHISIFGM